MCVYKYLVTIVVGDQKAPFSLVTTPGCRGGLYTFPWIVPLSLYVPYIAEVSSTIFKVFGKTPPGIEPRSTGLLANTLLTKPYIYLSIYLYIYIYIYIYIALSELSVRQ